MATIEVPGSGAAGVSVPSGAGVGAASVVGLGAAVGGSAGEAVVGAVVATSGVVEADGDTADAQPLATRQARTRSTVGRFIAG